jgi:hypothetical protein
MRVIKEKSAIKLGDNIGYLPAGIIANEMIFLYLKATAQAQILHTNPAGR